MNEEEIRKYANELSPEDLERRTKYVVAPKQMVELKLTVNLMCRVPPKDPWDSGWRLYHGNETTEMITDRYEDVFGLFNPSDVVYDKSIAQYLDSPVGSTYKRNKDGEFVLVVENNPVELPNDYTDVELITKDTDELEDLLGQNYDLGMIETDLSREEYIKKISKRVSGQPQLLFDEFTDMLRDIIAEKKQTIAQEEEWRIQREQEEKERKKERQFERITGLIISIPVLLYIASMPFVALYRVLKKKDRVLNYARAALLMGMLFFLVISMIYLFFKDDSEVKHRKLKGVLYLVLGIACCVIGFVLC